MTKVTEDKIDELAEWRTFGKTLWEIVVVIYESYGYTCEQLDLEYFYNSHHPQEQNTLSLAFVITNKVCKTDYDEDVIEEYIHQDF